MKKWPIVLTSLIIALAAMAYGINWKLSTVDFSESVPTDGIPLPSFEVENAVVRESSSPAASPSSTPAPSTKPTVAPSPSTEPSPAVEPSPSSAPVEKSTSAEDLMSAINNSSFSEKKDDTTHSDAPIISVDGGTIPEVITINNVVNITGTISCNPGILENITAEILNGDTVVQTSKYAPYLNIFFLSGTVNADLHFASLAVGDYTYRITATATNGDTKSTFAVIDEAFSVVAAGSAKSEEINGGAGGYVAKTSTGTTDADYIWNFLIKQFDNPYAAAGIMANMEAESSLNPKASQGDASACGYGLCQWTETRKQNLKDFAYIVSTDVSDLDLQLCFMMYELENDYPNLKEFLMNCTDGYLAASEFCAIYEQAASAGSRCDFAKKYLDRFALPD